jgi:hypothetical protein
MYLRDTAIIQHQPVYALLAALQEVMDLISALPMDVIALSTMTEGMDNPDMHKYADEMDKRHLVHNNRLLIFFFTDYSAKELPPQLADTSQPHLVTLPYSPHTTRNKYQETCYSALPPLADGSKAGPLNPSAATLCPTSLFLTSSPIGPTVNGRPGASFMLT